MSDDIESRLLRALFAIDGHGELADLIDLLRRGEADARIQARLAEAIDPDGASHGQFVFKFRQRGGAAKFERMRATFQAAQIGRYVQKVTERHRVPNWYAVEQAQREFGVSRATVQKAWAAQRGMIEYAERLAFLKAWEESDRALLELEEIQALGQGDITESQLIEIVAERKKV